MDLYRTTNGGNSWASVSGGAHPDFDVTLHADQHAIALIRRTIETSSWAMTVESFVRAGLQRRFGIGTTYLTGW
jgi:hypothetical protein